MRRRRHPSMEGVPLYTKVALIDPVWSGVVVSVPKTYEPKNSQNPLLQFLLPLHHSTLFGAHELEKSSDMRNLFFAGQKYKRHLEINKTLGILRLLTRRRLLPVLLVADRQRGLRGRLPTIPEAYLSYTRLCHTPYEEWCSGILPKNLRTLKSAPIIRHPLHHSSFCSSRVRRHPRHVNSFFCSLRYEHTSEAQTCPDVLHGYTVVSRLWITTATSHDCPDLPLKY
ncbi:hypothetical protein DER45DRAFT_148070 [Fusarium avenaceum]|nr:hypothetical protein DER45DRAFT_148070 [Fusarium avenaceum]